MTICIVGDPQDLAAVYMGWLAEVRGVESVTLTEQGFGVDWSVDLEATGITGTTGVLRVADRELELSKLCGAFVRLNPEPPLPEELDLPEEERFPFVLERRGALEFVLNALPCRLANPPIAGRSNGSKPYQMRVLTDAGFEVPRWVVTNDVDAARAFLEEGPAIYKAPSGLRSRVRRVDEELLERLAAGTTPVVLQRYVPGTDVRLHIVEGRPFPTEIRSEAGVDYRFDDGAKRYQPIEAPEAIVALCREVARRERLTLAGFDFRVTPDGRWTCLEVNPVPSFLPYEMETKQPIGAAVLDALIEA